MSRALVLTYHAIEPGPPPLFVPPALFAAHLDRLPLSGASGELARREVVDSRERLEQAAQTEVTSFAYPYNAPPSAVARDLVGRTYSAACCGGLDVVRPDADPLALPRVDSHYLLRG